VMADSDDDTADISNALLLEDANDRREAMPSTKRRKLSTKEEEPFDNLDVFLHETASKAKLSGSSFKNMGLSSSICILLIARLWTCTAEIYCTEGIQKPNADSTENNSSNHGRSRCCRNGTNRVRQNSISWPLSHINPRIIAPPWPHESRILSFVSSYHQLASKSIHFYFLQLYLTPQPHTNPGLSTSVPSPSRTQHTSTPRAPYSG
jgi:hypothetical protein